MVSTPEEIAADVRDAIIAGGGPAVAIVGWDRLFVWPGKYNIREGFLDWRLGGYNFDLTECGVASSPFYLFHHEVSMTGAESSLVVEQGVNKLDEVSRGIKGSTTAQSLEQRLVTDEQRCRLMNLADNSIVVPKYCDCETCRAKVQKRNPATSR